MELENWEPQENIPYKGYSRHSRRGYHSGKVLIHIKNNQYTGGFFISGAKVMIWYNENNIKREVSAPTTSCSFSKRREGNTDIYEVVINDDKIGEITTNNENDDEGYGMKSKRNEDDEVKFKVRPERAGIIDRITGRTSAIYLKKRYEDKLNEIWKEFDGTVEKIESQNTKFDELDTTVLGLKKTLQITREEWAESLTSLGNLLEKIERHEWEMWKTTQKSRNIKVQKNAPKIKYSDVDEMNFNSMTDFIKQYPELQSQKNVDKATQAVEEKRKEIINAQKELDKAIIDRNFVVSTFEKLTQKAEDNLDTFEELIKEAEEKVNKSRYNTSKIRNPLITDYERDATKLELLQYNGKLMERKSVLKRVKGQHSEYKRKAFVDMEH